MSAQIAPSIEKIGARLSTAGGGILTPERIQFSAPGFQWVMATISLMMFACDAWAAHQVEALGFLTYLSKGLPGLLPLIAINVYCRWRGFDRFVEFIALMIWTIVMLCLLFPLTIMAGRTNSALVDALLFRLDTGLHFSTGAIVQAIAHLPTLRLVLSVSYDLVAPLALAAILVPALHRRIHDSQRYVLSVTIAALLTLALFAIWPAAGPWRTEGFAPTKEQAAVESCLLTLKTPGPVELKFQRGNIVSFPSFHAAQAVLSAMALWGFRRLRWFALGLATLICVSTVTTGWHYLTDVLGGLAVTAVAFALARWAIKSPETPPLSASRSGTAAVHGVVT